VAARKFSMLLLVLFAVLALSLTVIGLYSVLAYAVTQRTPEIGIRMALGAQPNDVLKLVLKEGTKLTLLGVAIGLSTALALTRLLKSLLFDVEPKRSTDVQRDHAVAHCCRIAGLLDSRAAGGEGGSDGRFPVRMSRT
jgi:ABC-type antimicrobial peptide transport system permease subunit